MIAQLGVETPLQRGLDQPRDQPSVTGHGDLTGIRPVDYTGLTYGKLRGRRIAWPVNEMVPEGTDRLYTDPVFPIDTDQCQTYGHDLLTGGAVTEQEHSALAPAARAFLKGRPPASRVTNLSGQYN